MPGIKNHSRWNVVYLELNYAVRGKRLSLSESRSRAFSLRSRSYTEVRSVSHPGNARRRGVPSDAAYIRQLNPESHNEAIRRRVQGSRQADGEAARREREEASRSCVGSCRVASRRARMNPARSVEPLSLAACNCNKYTAEEVSAMPSEFAYMRAFETSRLHSRKVGGRCTLDDVNWIRVRAVVPPSEEARIV